MNKIEIEFTDDSNNEDGNKLSSNVVSHITNGFNIYSFTYKNETYTKTSSNVGTAYGHRHGGTYWNGQYINDGGSQVKQKEIYFAIYTIVPDGNHTGTWSHDEFYLNANNDGQYRTEQVDLQNVFSNLWDGKTYSPISNIVLDDPQETEIGKIEIVNNQWVETNVKLLTTNIPRSSAIGETFKLSAKTNRGKRFYNVKAFNANGDSLPAEYNETSVYDRHDVIIYIGDENVIGSGTPTSLVNYEGLSVSTLDQQIPEVLIRNFAPDGNGSFTSSGWSATDFESESTFGAEVSLLDYLQNKKRRGTALWKLGINGSKLDTEFSDTGSVMNYISANLESQINSLMSEYVQGRVRMVIFNVGMDDVATDIEDTIKESLQKIRTITNQRELPILLTITQSDQTDSGYVGLWQNAVAQNDLFTYAIPTNDLDRESDERTLTDDSLIALGIRYAELAVPLLQGELDISAYDPVVWIDPADSTFPQSGDLSILDNKGSGANFTAGGSDYATSGSDINGLNAVDFDITTNYRYNDYHPWGSQNDVIEEAEIFFVLTNQTTENGYIFISGGSQTSGGRFLCHAPWGLGRIYFDSGNANTLRVYSQDFIFEEGETIILALTTSKTENLIEMRINGKTIQGKVGGGQAIIENTFKINAFNTNGQNAIVGETLMFSNNIGLDNRLKIEGYLSHKWNIPLDNSHPYTEIAPTN